MIAYAGYILLFLLGISLSVLFLLFIVIKRYFLLQKFKKECKRAKVLSEAADHVNRLYKIEPDTLNHFPCVSQYLNQSKIIMDYYLFFDYKMQSELTIVPIYEKNGSGFNFRDFVKEVATVDDNIRNLLNDVSVNIATFYKTEHPLSYFFATIKKKMWLQILLIAVDFIHVVSKPLNLFNSDNFSSDIRDEIERDAIKV